VPLSGATVSLVAHDGSEELGTPSGDGRPMLDAARTFAPEFVLAHAGSPSGDGAGGGGACSRLADCCRASVDAMGGSVPAHTCDACDDMVGLQDATCERTMAAHRSGLRAMNEAVPAACN
jgi:hypothetical protein